MIDILNTFLSGITFALGVALGAVLCRMATKDGRKETAEEVREINNKIHDRLNSSLLCHERMALSLEALVDLKRREKNES